MLANKSKTASRYVIGIDEAGRGPLAGPVVVAGIKIESKIPEGKPSASYGASKNQKSKFWKNFRNIRDSKKLSVKKREEWFSLLTTHPHIEWAVARIWPKVIDRINITQAANLGAWRVCSRLSLEQNLEQVLLDGGLSLPSHIPHQAIIKGDEKIPAIAAASIIAKVTRDHIMLRLRRKYPRYRFDLHKGYGTKLHRYELAVFGYSDAHRKSFHFRNGSSPLSGDLASQSTVV